MAKKLFININLFTVNQDIFTVENGEARYKASIPLDRINEIVYSFNDVDEIEIDGNQDFIQKIGEDIVKELEKNYTNNNVRVKLNGEVFN